MVSLAIDDPRCTTSDSVCLILCILWRMSQKQLTRIPQVRLSPPHLYLNCRPCLPYAAHELHPHLPLPEIFWEEAIQELPNDGVSHRSTGHVQTCVGNGP